MRWLKYIVVGLLMLEPAWAITPEEQQRFADGLYTRQLNEMAIKEYNRIIQDFPHYSKNDLVLYRAGECSRRMGQAEQAMAYYSQIATVFPKSTLVPKALLRQGELHVQRGEFGNAIVLFKQLQATNPPADIASAMLYYQGYSYTKLQQIDPANTLFTTLIEKYPTSPFSSYAALQKAKNIGTKNAGKPSDELIALYKQAASNPPSERAGAEAQLALADQYFQSKMFAESSAAFARLFADYGQYDATKNASLNAAWAHYNAKDHARGLELVSKTDAAIKALKPADWMYLEANCYRHLDRDAEALKTYTALLEKYADSEYGAFASYEIALISFGKKDFETVVQQASLMLGQERLKEDGLWLIAESNRALNKAPEAIAHYKRLIAEHPASTRAPEATFNVALLLQKQDKFKEAAAQYRVVAAKYASHELAPRSLFAAGYCSASEGDHAQAIKDWDGLVTKFAQHELVHEGLYQKGLAEMQIKQESQAIATFKQLLDRNPENRLASEAAYWSAVMQERANKPAEAEALLKLALDKSPRADLVSKMQYRLALVLQKQGKKDESADFLQNLLATGGGDLLDPALIEWLIRHRWEAKDYKQALPVARHLTGEKVEEKWRQMGFGLLGYTLEQLGQKEEAAKMYLQGLTMESRTSEVVNGALFVGRYHMEVKEYDSAIKDFESTAAIASEVGMLDVQAKAYYALGEVSELTENWEDASRYFMSLAVLFDDQSMSPEGLFRAAAAFEKLGKAKERKQALQELAERYPQSAWAKKAAGQ